MRKPSPEERAASARRSREIEICRKADEIVIDSVMLGDAFEQFNKEYGSTGLMLCLSTISQCESAEQYTVHGAVLKRHIRHVAFWYAARLVPETSIFLMPQAG